MFITGVRGAPGFPMRRLTHDASRGEPIAGRGVGVGEGTRRVLRPRMLRVATIRTTQPDGLRRGVILDSKGSHLGIYIRGSGSTRSRPSGYSLPVFPYISFAFHLRSNMHLLKCRKEYLVISSSHASILIYCVLRSANLNRFNGSKKLVIESGKESCFCCKF